MKRLLIILMLVMLVTIARAGPFSDIEEKGVAAVLFYSERCSGGRSLPADVLYAVGKYRQYYVGEIQDHTAKINEALISSGLSLPSATLKWCEIMEPTMRNLKSLNE